MSFSLDCKQEIIRMIPNKRCCRLAELSALIKTTGIIEIINGKLTLKLNIENASVARNVFSLLKKVFNINIELMVKKNYYFNKHNTYILIIGEDVNIVELLQKTKILKSQEMYDFHYGIDQELIKSECCRRAYLRGLFLGSASVSDPEKTYHLEFVTDNYNFALDIEKLLNQYDLNAKIVKRKNYYIIYLKEGETIIDLLNIVGAHKCLLELENIRVYKEMRNNVNRIVNCETANLQKTVDASIRQVENIKLIERTIGINKLPESLIQIARLRVEYDDITLKELGEMLDPPVSKSGVNHRLRRIDEIANTIRGDKNDKNKH